MLKQGLYEQLINRMIGGEIKKAEEENMYVDVAPVDTGEASKVLSQYLAEVIEKGLDNVRDNGGSLADQIALVNRLVDAVKTETREDSFADMSVDRQAEQLLALFDKMDSILAVDEKAQIVRPVTSLAHSSLFTGAMREPQLGSELKKEIASCDRIDMLVSFIKWSGLRQILEDLKVFVQRGGILRIITTSYMGATDLKAIEELAKLPNTSIKVSYDTKRTRLHAKTYVFYRNTGFTTAYIGSSNLSNAAMTSGLEWDLKVTQKDQPETLQKIAATFESYWNLRDFELYDAAQRERLAQALKAEKYLEGDKPSYTFDILPYSYQQEILDKLEAERKVRGNFRNLVVAATGTGKTVISAFDYKRFCKANLQSPCRLLFVAHREEILKQSLYTFRGVLKDANFGEMFVGNYKPESIEHLFISIQTFNSQDFTQKTSPDFYDYIIVDEFHHAAAPTYQKLLTYYKPKILLGLTATPERMDGKNILEYFGNRIAAEIRLPEAIDRKLLSPFQYFGVTDVVDLNDLKWSRGGYEKGELERVYTFSGIVAKRRADMIIQAILRYVTDIDEVKGLGFCVSVEHAKFMAKYFNEHGIPSISLDGGSPEEDRNTAKQRLVKGEIRFIFVVDLYNEGVDIPEVNTVLFLRPTESLTVFLQQLGRGLRLAEGKECLTVLDFIGQANKRYNFEDKFASLLSDPSRGVLREMKEGFVSVPKGCYILLEKKAKQYIYDNIRASFGARAGLVARIANFTEDTGKELKLSYFLEHLHMDVRALYACDSFSRLCVQAGVRENFTEPLEESMRKAFPRFATVNSRRLLAFWMEMLQAPRKHMTAGEVRMLQMFQFTIWQKPYEECGFTRLLDGILEVRKNPTLCAELLELLRYNFERIDFIDERVEVGFDCPLDLHCNYTRDQILAALDFLKPSTVREGVKYLPDQKIDIAFVTLNKSDKDYSPSTMYQDYSVGEEFFHWQSQSTTSENSPTGQRYMHHREKGTLFLLFVRENKTDRVSGGAGAYTFLGKANYVQHEGSRPMSILWKLERPLPVRLQKKINELVGG